MKSLEGDGMKKALVVVDYQNDFVSGALGFPGAANLEKSIEKKIIDGLAAGADLLFTFDTHDTDYLATQEGRKLPVPHCEKGTEGWDLYGAIAAYRHKATWCFEKCTFGSLELAEYLKVEGYDVVELVGLVSNICVISNAILAKAALPEAEIIVDAACTASADEEMHEKALDVLQGVHVTVINR